MSDNILKLHPVEPSSTLDDLKLFIRWLQKINFVAHEYDFYGETYYRIGKEFFDHIIFEEDFTAVVVEPLNEELMTVDRIPNKYTCHVSVSEFASPELLGGGNISTPQCRVCGYEIIDFVQV